MKQAFIYSNMLLGDFWVVFSKV